jgi:LmbE family N-acetylglucosaminyl deacetylase
LRYNAEMSWIFLSPHFDDAALSCGGLVWELAQSGEQVSIWTMCAGEAPTAKLSPFAMELHARWRTGEDAHARRMSEDISSCRHLGAGYLHFSIPDCIYRRHPQTGEFLYPSEASLNGPLHPEDDSLVGDLQANLMKTGPARANLVCPLALGSHVDHQLTRLAAEKLETDLWYYADFPYALRTKTELEQMVLDGWGSQVYPISARGLRAWQDAIAEHASQISTFWPNEQEMRHAISDYLIGNGGIRLWRRSTR